MRHIYAKIHLQLVCETLDLQGAGFILIKCVWFSHVKQPLFYRLCSSSPASEGRWPTASVLRDRVYQLHRCAWITSTADRDGDPEKPDASAHWGNRPKHFRIIPDVARPVYSGNSWENLWNFQRLLIIPPAVTIYMKSSGWKRERWASTVETAAPQRYTKTFPTRLQPIPMPFAHKS